MKTSPTPPRKKSSRALVPAALIGILATTLSGHAASGTWTSLNEGLWSNGGNWNGGIVADDAGSTAFFNALDLNAAVTVHLDSARTIGGLNFQDPTTPFFGYTIDNNGNSLNVLTLAGTTPTITVGASTTATISAEIAGTSGLNKAGSGNLILSGVNTYSGTTSLVGNVGYIQVNSNSALGSSTLYISNQNGGIRYGAAFNDLRNIAFGSGGGRMDVGAFNVTYSSTFSGSIAAGNYFSKYGAGTLTLAGTNEITGPGGINIGEGYVQIDSNARLGSGTGPLLLNGGGIKYGAAFDDLRSITLGNADGRLDTNGFNVTFSGSLIGGAGQDLRKEGLGTLTITGTQNYGGTTVANAGTLLINGSHTAAGVTINNTATLGGIGTITGNTTVASGGILSAGNGQGTLTFESDLTLAGGAGVAGATAIFEGGDLVDVNGTLTLNNDWNLTLTTGFQDGGSVTLFTYTTKGATFDLTPDFNIAGLGFTPTGPLTLTDTGSSIILNGISAVPEPGTIGMLFLGGVALLVGIRRRILATNP